MWHQARGTSRPELGCTEGQGNCSRHMQLIPNGLEKFTYISMCVYVCADIHIYVCMYTYTHICVHKKKREN